MWHICSVRIVYLVNCGTSSHFQAAKLIPAEVRRQQRIAFLASHWESVLVKVEMDYPSFIFRQFWDMERQMCPLGILTVRIFSPSSWYIPSQLTRGRERECETGDWHLVGIQGNAASLLLQMEAHQLGSDSICMCKGCCFTHQIKKEHLNVHNNSNKGCYCFIIYWIIWASRVQF